MGDRYMIRIVADTNDGDYTQRSIEFTEKEYELAIPVVERVIAVLHKKHGTWETGDFGNSVDQYVEDGFITPEDMDIFSGLVPRSENGIHTIESIEVYKYSEKKRIY